MYSGRVAEVLREAIVDGVLEEGTPLVETQLAAQLAVLAMKPASKAIPLTQVR